MENIRNVAIIAHVDHGKTTLVDQLLRQSGTFQAHEKLEERVMDSMDLEKEKGITIRAKNASLKWDKYHINIVDTPGHADFGGEVERIMKMVDGVLLVVDAYEGPQAQTKFVLRKAMENGLKPVVVINKIDRDNARPHKVLDMVFELFLELNATDEQLDFPHIYASAKAGFAKRELVDPSETMVPLYEAIAWHIPAPKKSEADYFQMLVSNLDYSDYLGRIAYGRVISGSVKVGQSIVCIHADGRKERANVTAIFGHQGMEKVKIESAAEGDIIGLAGFEDVFIGETLVDNEEREALPFIQIDPPTISMRICVNDSPLAGREGKLLTARQIKDRLIRETRTNVSLQVSETEAAGQFEVKARGEMQIAILVEQMRREGFELLVSRPEVIFQRDAGGSLLEPMETLYVDVPPDNLGDILQSLAARKADIANMEHHPHSVLVQAVIPTRGIIGLGDRLGQRDQGPRHHEPSFQRIRTAQRRHPQPRQRRAHFHGGRDQHGLRARYHPGTRTPFHRAAGRNLRGHDRRRERASGRFAGQSLQSEKADQHAQPRRRQGHPVGPADPDDPRALARIHRARRIRRSHAQDPASPQEAPRRHRPQAGRVEDGGLIK